MVSSLHGSVEGLLSMDNCLRMGLGASVSFVAGTIGFGFNPIAGVASAGLSVVASLVHGLTTPFFRNMGCMDQYGGISWYHNFARIIVNLSIGHTAISLILTGGVDIIAIAIESFIYGTITFLGTIVENGNRNAAFDVLPLYIL